MTTITLRPTLIAETQNAACAMLRVASLASPRECALISPRAMKSAGKLVKQPHMTHDAIAMMSAATAVPLALPFAPGP